MRKTVLAIATVMLGISLTLSACGIEEESQASVLSVASSQSTQSALLGNSESAAETSAEDAHTAAVSAVVSDSTDKSTTPLSRSVQVQRILIQSEYLNKTLRANVYLPGDYSNTCKYPVLYLFHGYSGDQNMWEDHLNLIGTATKVFSEGESVPYIIVTPDIENSYGINSKGTATEAINFNGSVGNYEDYIVRELINYIDTHYSTEENREGRFIGGLSMGGYAALHICFDHPELFSKVGGHSPALWLSSDKSKFAKQTFKWLYPTYELRKERDPLLTAEGCDLAGIKIWLDCGTKDGYGLYTGIKELYDILTQKGADVQYHSWKGVHKSSYWKAHLESYLIFYGSD